MMLLSLIQPGAQAIVLASLAVLLLSFVQRVSKRRALPPGPPGWPIVGNAIGFDRRNAWRKFMEWNLEYGDVVYFRLFRRSLLVLNSLEAALDLEEKRPLIYSDRPRRVMAELSGYDDVTTFRVRYDDAVKLAKKYLHVECSKASVSKHAGRQEQVAYKFCESLKEKPESFRELIRESTVSVIRIIFYGDEAVFNGLDAFDDLSEDVIHQFSKMATPSQYLVDALPFLRHLPRWFPGATFQYEAARNKRQIDRFMGEPYYAVKQQIEKGIILPSFLSNILMGEGFSPEKEETIKWTAGSAYGAGFETTVTSLTTFFLAMILNPDVQVKAKAEIDTAVGKGRLPSFSDRPSLPYVNSIVSEVMRWRPPVPFAWRCVRTDDTYRGYFIPAGTLVTVNTRALAHNPQWYRDPDDFKPERFLDEHGQFSANVAAPDPRRFVFGFGRRSCPGAHLADSFMFIVIACILASFTMEPEQDENGEPILPNTEWSPGMGGICEPPSFRCKIVPRT